MRSRRTRIGGMKGVKCVAFLVVFSSLWGFSREADVLVYCTFMESCLLKDSFKAGSEVVIHWIQVSTGDTQVHSYYHDKNQLSHQNPRFANRTQLFLDQISKGNASLLLKETQFEDSGRYKCYTSTITGIEESFVNLKVHVPVRKVTLQQLGDVITCSSDGIYPKPDLSWTTGSNIAVQANKYSTEPTDHHVYNIRDSLTLPSGGQTPVNYTCQVSTEMSSGKATFSQTSPISVSEPEVKLRCSSSNAPLTSLVWSFNHSQTILIQNGTQVDAKVTERWRQRVKAVSGSGDLTLHGLTPEQGGVYTCLLANAEETFLTNTILKVEEGGGHSTKSIVIGVTITLLVIIIIIIIIGIACRITGTRRQQTPVPGDELKSLNSNGS